MKGKDCVALLVMLCSFEVHAQIWGPRPKNESYHTISTTPTITRSHAVSVPTYRDSDNNTIIMNNATHSRNETHIETSEQTTQSKNKPYSTLTTIPKINNVSVTRDAGVSPQDQATPHGTTSTTRQIKYEWKSTQPDSPQETSTGMPSIMKPSTQKQQSQTKPTNNVNTRQLSTQSDTDATKHVTTVKKSSLSTASYIKSKPSTHVTNVFYLTEQQQTTNVSIVGNVQTTARNNYLVTEGKTVSMTTINVTFKSIPNTQMVSASETDANGTTPRMTSIFVGDYTKTAETNETDSTMSSASIPGKSTASNENITAKQLATQHSTTSLSTSVLPSLATNSRNSSVKVPTTTKRTMMDNQTTITHSASINPSEMPDMSNTTDIDWNSTVDPERLQLSFSEEDTSDSFWPVVVALTIAIPTVIVFGVTITVLYRRRMAKPRRPFSDDYTQM